MPIGTVLTIASLAASAGSAGGSFAQAARARRMKEDAERAAEKAVREARKRGEVNYYDQLAIAKSPYDLEREAMINSAAQAMEAAREASTRGVAATAGRLQQFQAKGQRDIASRMESEAQRIEQLKATEGARVADMMYNLSLAEAEGAQLAARDAEEARSAAMTAGFKSIGSAIGQAAALPALYPEQKLKMVDTIGDQTVNYATPDMAGDMSTLTSPAGAPRSGAAGEVLQPGEFGAMPAAPDVTATQAPYVMDPLTYSVLAGREAPLRPAPASVTGGNLGVQPAGSFGAPDGMRSAPAPQVAMDPQLTSALQNAQSFFGMGATQVPIGTPSMPSMQALPPQQVGGLIPRAQLMGQTVPFATPSAYAPFAQPAQAQQSQMAAYLQYLNSLNR